MNLSWVAAKEHRRETCLTALVIVLSAAALFAHATYLAVPLVDDAGTSAAYAKTFFTGHGLRLTNESPPVEAFSNPLWTLLLGLALPFRQDPARFASGLSEALMLLCVPVYALWGAASRGRLRIEDACAPLVMAVTPCFAYWGSSGMEVSLLSLLLGVGGLYVIHDLRRGRGVVSGLAFGLAGVTRPEAPLYAIAAGLFWACVRVRERRWPGRQEIIIALQAVGLPAAYLIFRRVYFDAWVPNTYLAKMGADMVDHPYLRSFFKAYSLFVVVGVLGAVMAVVGGASTRRVAGLGIALVGAGLIFALRSAGDWMIEWRFLAPLVPVWGVLIGAGASALRDAPRASLTGTSVRGIHFFAPWLLVALLASFFAREAWLARPRSKHLRDSPELPASAVARLAGLVHRHIRSLGIRHSRVGFPDIGGLALVMRDADVVDTGRLADSELARYITSDAAAADYLSEEAQPDYIDSHGPSQYLKRKGFEGFLKRYVPLHKVAPKIDVAPGILVLNGLTPEQDPRCPGGRQATLDLTAIALEGVVEQAMREGRPKDALSIWRCAWAWQVEERMPDGAWRTHTADVAEAASRATEGAGDLEAATRFESLATVLSFDSPRRRHRTESLRLRLVASRK